MTEKTVDFGEVDAETDRIAKEIVDSAFQVHANLGPGLLESAYESCLMHEISGRGLRLERQVEMPLVYKDARVEAGFRVDLWVERKVIVEIKAVEHLLPIHRAQLMTYLKLSKNKLGFLLNFNVMAFKQGIERMIFSR